MSITETDKLRARVATLDKLLDDFDGQLDDLLAKSLPETLLGLDTLQQAKLQVTIPYLVYDLVMSASLSLSSPEFSLTEDATQVYLKTKGIDPRTHPVFRELVRYSCPTLTFSHSTQLPGSQERVKEYIEKVSKAEKRESEQRSYSPPTCRLSKCSNSLFLFSPTERMTIDKTAANRFIKHAITQAIRPQDQPSQPADQGPIPGPSKSQAQPVPTGAASKILARARWEKQVQEAGEEEEEDLEIFEEAEGSANADADIEMTDDKASASTPLPTVPGEASISSEQQPGMSMQ